MTVDAGAVRLWHDTGSVWEEANYIRPAQASIVNADVSASAAIAYSKLALTGSVVNADINASAGIVDTKLATIATAGKVSNSATTATDANTASAIVARDGSGNFTAGTITANLTGNVTGTAPAGTLTGTTLASNVVTSSLTTIGTLAAGAVPASLVTAGTFGTGAYAIAAGSTTNALVVTTTGAVQQSIRYDGSNRVDVAVTSSGAASISAVGASAAVTVTPRLVVSASSSANYSADFASTSTNATVASSTLGLRGQGIAGHTTGTNPLLRGVTATATISGAGGTTTTAAGLTATVFRSAGTLGTGVAVDVNAMSSTMTNAYGIRVGDITGGSSLNYAIYTGTGLVRFGDVVNTTLAYQVNGTQVVGAQGAAVADATDAASVIARLNDLLSRLRAHGLIAT